MKRLARPAAYTATSVAALWAFVRAERWSVDPLDWRDPRSWIDRIDPEDALVEMARWLGIALAAYVALTALMALLAEASLAMRMPRLAGGVRRVVSAVAFPALRRRLLEVTTAATITASSLHAPVAGAVGAPAPAALVADVQSGPPLVPTSVRGQFEGFGAVGSAAPTAPTATHVVAVGDTLWDIVDAHYGRVDNDLVAFVAAANPHIDDPGLIRPGWTVTLPDSPAPVVPVSGEASWAVVTVQPGDTLWGIVERHYGNATADLVWATVAANPGVDDPNVIRPGQLVTLPPQGEQDVEPPTGVPPPDPVDVPTAPPADVVDATTSVPTPTNPPAPIEAPPADVTQSAVPTSTVPPVIVAASVSGSAEAPRSVIAKVDEDTIPPLAAIVGWTGGAGLAAALLGLAARRRRHLPTAVRYARPPKRAVELAVAMRETDNYPLVDATANALRSLASRLRPRPGEATPMPRLLRLADQAVELVWDSPNTDVLAPWTSADGGWSWNLERPDLIEPSDACAPCPGLVTIGRRGGADVLLNVESCGALSITGESHEVEELIRSVAIEAAESVFADAPLVLMVGGPNLAADPDHARHVSSGEAIGWLRDRSDSAGSLLAHRRLTSLFALRARSKPEDSHEPVIVIVDPSTVAPDDVGRMVELANGDLGAVVLLRGEHPSVEWRIECSGREVRIQPLGLTLSPLGLSETVDELIDEFVPPADPTVDDFGEDGFDDETDARLGLADHLNVIATRERVEPTPVTATDVDRCLDEDFDDGGWDVELKVLGQVRCVGSNEPLTPTELHLAIYLAFNRKGENRDTIETMIWPNGAVERTITNAMASLRRKLGQGPDGEPLFPYGRNHQHTYHLSSRVTTDWDRFVALVQKAGRVGPEEALPLLDQALTMVDGPPFRAAFGYSWAYSDGTATLVTETIKAAGRRSAELHTQRGELTEAATALAVVMNVIGTADMDPDQLI
jgi:nucleoid-associated protein YgaU